MKRNWRLKSISAFLIFVFMFSQIVTGTSVEYGDAVIYGAGKYVNRENGSKRVNFMPPNPNIYPDYYKKGTGETNKAMFAAEENANAKKILLTCHSIYRQQEPLKKYS